MKDANEDLVLMTVMRYDISMHNVLLLLQSRRLEARMVFCRTHRRLERKDSSGPIRQSPGSFDLFVSGNCSKLYFLSLHTQSTESLRGSL